MASLGTDELAKPCGTCDPRAVRELLLTEGLGAGRGKCAVLT